MNLELPTGTPHLTYQSLKSIHRERREQFTQSLSLRVHRALSWLAKSELCDDDEDSQFIFLWIAFNAAYAKDIDAPRTAETVTFGGFVSKLLDLDKDGMLYKLTWNEYSSSIRLLLDNQFVFQPFWDHQNGHISERQWIDKFVAAKKRANSALANEQTDVLLSIILQRLYTLRNQLVHGGATWQGQANRSQIRDAVAFMKRMVPATILIMLNNKNTLWGEPNYPLIQT